MTLTEFDPSRDLYLSSKVIILGGGCYGSFFSSRIAHAKEKGLIDYSYQLIVDTNPECEAKMHNNRSDILFFNGDWMDFFATYVAYFINDGDYVVLPCNTPHFIYRFFIKMLELSRSHQVETLRLPDKIGFPYEEFSVDSLYVSYAEWECPSLCREPQVCPGTQGQLSWNVKETLLNYFSRAKEVSINDLFFFESDITANGVALISAKKIIKSFKRLISTADVLPKIYLIATLSKCHGAISLFRLE